MHIMYNIPKMTAADLNRKERDPERHGAKDTTRDSHTMDPPHTHLQCVGYTVHNTCTCPLHTSTAITLSPLRNTMCITPIQWPLPKAMNLIRRLHFKCHITSNNHYFSVLSSVFTHVNVSPHNGKVNEKSFETVKLMILLRVLIPTCGGDEHGSKGP